MYTPELATKSDFYDQFVTNKISNVQATYLPSSNYSDYSDSGPLNIYNNYNPNFHHHHYYYPNFDSCHSIDHNWIRKFDYENQKEYFTANTPSPAEFCDFEIPQQQSSNNNNNLHKSSKLHNEVDKYFFDTTKSSLITKDQVNNNLVEQCKILSPPGSEKSINSSEVKVNPKNSKRCKTPLSPSSDLGAFDFI